MGTDHTDHDYVPVLVDAALQRGDQQSRRLHARATRCAQTGDHQGHAAALRQLAQLYRREARWWTVQANWTFAHQPGPAALRYVQGRAALTAHRDALTAAKDYDQYAASADRLPATSAALVTTDDPTQPRKD